MLRTLPVRVLAARRRRSTRLPARVDVLVVGGGITGVGVALDAASRGASVALVERGDLASGTSSRSSRLVHGGARYLATGDVAMVAEGVRERDRLRRMAPHLVLPLPFVIPTDSTTDLALLRVGDDRLRRAGRWARRRTPPPPRRRRGARGTPPGLARGFRRGGVRYWDCRTDDARLTLEVARAAVAHGAVVATHTEVVGLHRVGGRVIGATCATWSAGGDAGDHGAVGGVGERRLGRSRPTARRSRQRRAPRSCRLAASTSSSTASELPVNARHRPALGRS